MLGTIAHLPYSHACTGWRMLPTQQNQGFQRYIPLPLARRVRIPLALAVRCTTLLKPGRLAHGSGQTCHITVTFCRYAAQHP
jgi:hypothetical protein